MGELPGFNEVHQRFTRLLGYLAMDPDNLNLIGDATAAAVDAGLPDKALELLDRYGAIAPLPPTLMNIKGLVALQQDRFDDAIAIFEPLLTDAPNDSNLRFNLAWSRTMVGDDVGAAQVLDETTVMAIPGAATLKVQALHRLGDLEAALQNGVTLAESRPNDTALMGALSLVAIDSQMPELALACASKSQDTSEGLSTLGVLTLQDYHIDDALAYFERGLVIRPDSPRNLLGKGLALMAAGDAHGAANFIDQSATLFKSHLGTWIAAGWAHFATDDRPRARTIFEHALALDDTFSETHGALAVLDILDGNIESARRRTDTALRLDRRCFAGALAKSLLLEHDGNPEAAQRVRELTVNAPLDASGHTIAQAMIAIAPNWRNGAKR